MNVPLVVFVMSRVLPTCLRRQSVRSFTMDTLSSRLTSLHQKSEDMISIGYAQVAISFATRSVAALRTRQKMLETYRENPEVTAFDKLIF